MWGGEERGRKRGGGGDTSLRKIVVHGASTTTTTTTMRIKNMKEHQTMSGKDPSKSCVFASKNIFLQK